MEQAPEQAPRLVPMGVARERYGLTRRTLARLVREGRVTVYTDPTDRRVKLLDLEELRRALEPQPRPTTEAER